MAGLSFLAKLNPYAQLKQQFNEVKKQFEMYKRAEQPYSADYREGEDVMPLYPYSLDSIYTVAYYSDILSTIHKALRTQMFKNGYEVLKSEDTDENVVDEEEENQEEPDVQDRKRILNFLKNCNREADEITDVLEKLEDDLNILDLYFCNFKYDYYYNEQDRELKRSLVAVQRVDPRTMRLVINNRTEFGKDSHGNQLMFSVSNRSQILKNVYRDKDGVPTLPAYFKQIGKGHALYFAPWEMKYDKRYRPSEILGFSPVITCWQKSRTLALQDKYILELYEGKRPPKGLLAFNTSNKETLKEAWTEMLTRAKANPHLPAVMGVTNNLGGSGKFVEFVDFMKSLEELQFTEQRDEFRRTIGALYGVSPIFQNDLSTGGGLNNEGLQITVTNDAIQSGQTNYNKKLLKHIVNELGADGWSIQLKPSEEQDEMARLERQEQSLRNGELAVRMGLKVKYDSRQGEVVIDDGDLVDAPKEEDFGGFGGEEAESPDIGDIEPLEQEVEDKS